MAEKYIPVLNGKKAMQSTDYAGWYEVVSVDKSNVLCIQAFWWNGKEWNHGPNKRRGWSTEELEELWAADRIKGITRLAP